VVFDLGADEDAPACYDIAAAQFAPVLEKLRALIEVDLRQLEEQAETAGSPWTPGRVPAWKPE